ncbi:MAG: hypothetical protein JO206_10990 [Solirubrobacterales bacterium]|nr:hypothetical protein [Solirubrobacterales bacterium]MBV9473485.1 hypothetical protein [Solirubrobacterales bacterium]
MSAITGGGTDGNERLTASTGIVLLILLAAIGITILRIGQLISEHLFIGLLLIGPVTVKMASTGYRFVRYYSGESSYRHKGPPPLWLRSIAPMVVISTVVVFASGVALLFNGPSGRALMLTVHKVSFIVWIAFTAAHVLGHVFDLPGSWRASSSAAESQDAAAGRAGRWIVLGGSLVGGLVLALALIGQFAPWTAHGALLHHHRH